MKEVSRFLRLLTHDLQNQVGAIDLNLQILPTVMADGPTASEFIGRASGASRDLISVLEDVQYFVRAVSREDDGETPTLTRCDLATKVRECTLALQAAAQARKVNLKSVTSEEAFVCCETDSCRRAIQILAGEAIRSAPPGSNVELVVVTAPVPTVAITVSVEGVFDESRATLATYLARVISRSSNVTMLMRSESELSRVELLFPPG